MIKRREKKGGRKDPSLFKAEQKEGKKNFTFSHLRKEKISCET